MKLSRTVNPVIGPPPTLGFAKRSMGVGRMVKQEHAGGREVAPIGAGWQVPQALPVGLHLLLLGWLLLIQPVGAFQERQVTVGSGEWALPGTLMLPDGAGPFPVVVLVHGSGAHDRDETIGPNKPFRDLAWGLASQQVATLRYEKRTKAYAKKIASILTTFTANDETVDDAVAAVAFLRRVPEIQATQIYVLGHSFGGMMIPRIGRQDPHIAGFIIFAGNTRALDQMLLEQMSYLFSLDGTLTPAEQAQLDQANKEVAKIRDPNLSLNTPPPILGAGARYWLDLRDYHPQEEAKALAQPLLIVQGGRDYQVTLEDFHQWQSALSARHDVTFKLYPSLNHLFMEGEGKSTPAEYAVAGHMAPSVIRDIANWVKRRAQHPEQAHAASSAP